MSDTPASLRRKIDGAQKIEAVVRTMKAMAASSIGQYEAAVRALGDYQRSVELGLSSCLRAVDPSAVNNTPAHPSERVISAIIFGSDQGLVGRFNEVIADFATLTLNAIAGKKLIWAIGARVSVQLQDAGMALAGQFTVPSSVAAITALVNQIQIESQPQGCNPGDAEVYVFHNRPQAAALYEPVSQRLLPLDAQWRAKLLALAWPSANLPETLGDNNVTLAALLREYLFISLYKACAESLASENGSRLAAMQRAEENIKRLSANLSQTFYRMRQSAIDEELFDVLAGFNALAFKTRHPRYEIHE
jgi:F-type H+-transporting ATPase subunit gamma